jgi:hypothetical protein
MDETSAPTSPQAHSERRRPDRLTLALRGVVAAVITALVLVGAWLGYAYAVSPAVIRHPQSTHYHFRLQLINAGRPVNFANAKFQESEGTVCSVALTSEPIHFHDNLDQFVHIHWAHMTGGLFLKNYGWNFLGGPDDTLGYRFDQLPKLTRVPIHAQALPKPPANVHYYVYTGTDDAYYERSWTDFLHQDLRDFFAGKRSAMGAGGLLGRLVPTAQAHGDDPHLTALNDVLGSVVIFAQTDRPTDAQIKDRFNHLVPLPESTCGG